MMLDARLPVVAAQPVYTDLPRLALAELALHNRICLAGDGWAFALGSGTATLGLATGLSWTWTGTGTARVEVELGGTVLVLWLSTPLAETLDRLLGTSTANLDGLGPEAMAMVAEHAATQALTAFEKRLGCPVAIVSATSGVPPSADARALRMTAHHPALGPEPVALWMTGPTVALNRVADMLIRHPSRSGATPPPDLGRLPVRTARESPPFRLPHADLAGLSAGRVLVLEGGWTPADTGRMRLPGDLSARIARMPDGLVFDGYEADSPIHGMEGHDTMNDIPEADAPVPLDDLEVTLTLELDRATMTLAQLSALRQGAVLPFRSTDPETVRVMANGAFFARGELLFVDDRIGVRLTQLA